MKKEKIHFALVARNNKYYVILRRGHKYQHTPTRLAIQRGGSTSLPFVAVTGNAKKFFRRGAGRDWVPHVSLPESYMTPGQFLALSIGDGILVDRVIKQPTARNALLNHRALLETFKSQ